MRSDHHYLRNALSLLFAQAVAALAGIFAFTRIGRQLPVTELGRYGFAVSSTAMFGLLAEFGIRYAAMKKIAVAPAQAGRIYRHGAVVRWAFSLATLAVLAGATSVPAWRHERELLLLAGLVAVSQFGSDPATWVLFGKGRVDLGAGMLVADRLLYLLGIHAAAWILPSAECLLVGALAANLVRLGIGALWIRRDVAAGHTAPWDGNLFRQLAAGGAGIGVAILAAVAYAQTTVVLVKVSASPVELGYYAMAFGIVNVVLVVPTSLTMALFPTLAVSLGESAERRRNLHRWAAAINLFVALPITAFLLLFSKEVLVLWMGLPYLPAAVILRVLAPVVTLTALTFMYRLFLFADHRYRSETFVNLAAIAVVAAAGMPLCRAHGPVAVAVLLVAVEASILATKLLVTRRWLGRPSLLSAALPSLVAVALPALAVVATTGLRFRYQAAIFLTGSALLTALVQRLPGSLYRTKQALVARKTQGSPGVDVP